MIYYINSQPNITVPDIIIATALNGVVYTENGRLHVKSNTRHYVYKPYGSPIGWYARHPKTLDDIYLGVGASPTIELENLEIKDEQAWNELNMPELEEDLVEYE